MLNFEKYMSLKRFGTQETQGIEKGTCYIFPKLDGTNSSVWYNPETGVEAGSRNRHLDETSKGDNAGFCKWAKAQENIKEFLKQHSHLRLFGEWLVPHSLKTYQEDAWKRFYIFDVYDHNENRFLTYEEYLPLIKEFNFDYIPLLYKTENPTEEELIEISKENTFLVTEGIGEGIVIKRYDFINKYGRTIFSKIVTDEFLGRKKDRSKTEVKQQKVVEEEIVNEYCTEAFIKKEYNKMLLELENEGKQWSNKYIGKLLHQIHFELINEEAVNFVFKYKHPIINFRKVGALTTEKVKETLPELFQ
jgi:hypothetical protein